MADPKATTQGAAPPIQPPGGTPPLDSRRLGEVVIEMGDEKCSNFLWPITRHHLRGRWTRSNIKQGIHQSLGSMPDLPGIQVVCDPPRRIAALRDPLGDPANEDTLKKSQAVYHGAFHEAAGPQKDTSYERLNDDAIRTWLTEMRKAVDGGRARLVSGELPTLDQIDTLPGRTRIELFSNSQTGRKFKDDPPVEARR